MCGIFGIIFHGDKHHGSHDDVAWLFTTLALEASVRGTDATGLARIEKDGYSCIYKNVKPSWKIMEYRRWWRPLGNVTHKTHGLLGHTRWGTHGENTIENAHPFRFVGSGGTVVGIHNGVISNYAFLGPTPPLDNDSANFYYRLSNTKKSEWATLLNRVSGSFALAWSDGENIYLARNSSSPCSLVYCPELDATVFASTEDILKKAFATTSYVLDHKAIRYLPVGVIRTFCPGSSEPHDERFEQYGTYMSKGYSKGYHGGYQGQRCLPLYQRDSTEDSVAVCVTCGSERSTARMVYDQDLSGFECVDCRGCAGQCDWCKQFSPNLKRVDEYRQMLCLGCRLKCGKADLITYDRHSTSSRMYDCRHCGSEFDASLVNFQIFYNTDTDDYTCQDCYGISQSAH